nr:4Fe-4S single cluster domain-containing protein [Pseudomonas aeruginosa]
MQGCNKRCRGCCNPSYLQLVERELVSASSVIEWLESVHHAHDLEGVTFLGGEPMLQAQGLAVVAQGAQSLGLSVMVFSGYTKTELNVMQLPGVDQLLRYTDVLVDGPYEASLPEISRRWAGSTNQQFHYLTARYDARIESNGEVERVLEVRLGTDGSVFINGWPENFLR